MTERASRYPLVLWLAGTKGSITVGCKALSAIDDQLKISV
jgi:hypothetical protein